MLGLRLTLAAPGIVAAQDARAMRESMRALGGNPLSGKKLDRAVEKANENPFGSVQNPVRANGPEGQRAYLRRLRCADETRPKFERRGNAGIGPYGTIQDIYAVQCGADPVVTIYIDMYHEHIEAAPVPGFTIVPPEGERPA
ncbi:hypothetical protein [Sphingomonas koreensis]